MDTSLYMHGTSWSSSRLAVPVDTADFIFIFLMGGWRAPIAAASTPPKADPLTYCTCS